ncbi:tyrosine-type recombinase/integrase [Geomonas oryzisoli]|uniref:Tyrosine-type recombinase/integrase n=1 Tax=Geomonas oryzisoli TaxID=2847992 RepID=A0ABX8J5Z9_9BACT|nr:tyrosine-type recombinase/integrase [Geomonas oryzisoli]QWV93740.1 tyrosine-type recombinase/integrase [Geomonas oryzisoli]
MLNVDPQLHSHVFALNVVHAQDGSWKANEPKDSGSRSRTGPRSTSSLTGLIRSWSEFVIFYQGIQKFNKNIRDCFLSYLYHGLRSQEAATLRWEYVNLDRLTLTIPGTKNRRPLYTPLCRQSLEILERRLAQREEGCPWAFPAVKTVRYSTNKTGHVRLMAAALRLYTGLDITVHGLRRAFITMARRLKIFEDADRLTNHVDSTIAGRRYDATDVEDLRRPLQTIANELERQMFEGGCQR